MIFCRIFKNYWHGEHTIGSHHLATRVQGAPTPLGVPLCLVGPWCPPPRIPAPTHFFFLPKNHQLAQARVLVHFAAIFNLLAQSTSHKTALGDCSLVCDSSICPISFCSSTLFIAKLCCLGDHVLELACQIYVVPNSSNA